MLNARPETRFGILLAAAAFVLAGWGSHSAWAGNEDALIVVGADSSSTIADQINTRLAITSAMQNLAPLYGSTDLLNTTDLSSAALASAILRRRSAEHVDVLILSAEPKLAPRAVFRAAHFSRFRNLRLVYVSGGSSPAVAREWRNIGARLSVAQSDFTHTSSLSAQRFIMRWAQGWSAEDAAKDAESYAASTLERLGRAARIQTEPGLAITGENLDESGKSQGAVSFSHRRPVEKDYEAPMPAVAMSAFEQAALGASTALVPAVSVDPSQVHTTQDFLDQAGPVAWGQLQSLFSSGEPQAPAVDTDPVAQEIWIDGEFLQYISGPLQKYLGGLFSNDLKYIQGVKLDRSPTHLEISIYFSQEFDVELRDPSTVSDFQLYGVHFPKTVRVSVASSNGTVTLQGLDDAQGPEEDQLFLLAKIPLLSRRVYLHDVSVQLTSGDLTADAGILGNTVGLVADARIFASKVQPKIDIWKSIEANAPLFGWPILTFRGFDSGR